MKRQFPVAQGDVGGGDAVEAAQVVVPRFVDDHFDKTAGLVDIVQQLPRQRTVREAAAAAF